MSLSNLRVLHNYLDIELNQFYGGVALFQTKYIHSILHRFSLEDCKPIVAPVETCLKISCHDVGYYGYVTLFQQSIGCLIYACIMEARHSIFNFTGVKIYA